MAHLPPRFTISNRRFCKRSDGSTLLISFLRNSTRSCWILLPPLASPALFPSFEDRISTEVRKMQEQTTSSLAANSLPSSSERSSSSAPPLETKEGMESDEEIRRVPEFGGEITGTENAGRNSASAAGQEQVQTTGGERQRKRGRSSADKENKRLKRLLRNRVSAQQARERKKAYLTDLEKKVKDLENKNSELEERLSTLQNENQMLRHILKNTTANKNKRGDNGDGSNPES
ncbi:hypothetical protein EUTSA_v10004860mg [Eutrema salsugineum]|uniref:Transcription factor HY5 n=1 Tax=Eutrema salsugineum TaxID=72664 RepID=V4KLI9_EUTSA|nr:transcription factor HY5 [Eutrema salsugineum]ESQ32079.1 hypothetical protein EUTSA_v10004860mg [Eutrema salsugineum]